MPEIPLSLPSALAGMLGSAGSFRAYLDRVFARKGFLVPPIRRAALTREALIATMLTAALAGPAIADDAKPVAGGSLVYLEEQAHTNLYPPAGGFYPNGGILNQITDKLTWQNPRTLEIEPWIAESWTANATDTEYTFKIRGGVTFSDGTPLDADAVAKNFNTYGLGNKALKQPVSEVINNYDHRDVIDPHTVKFDFKIHESLPQPQNKAVLQQWAQVGAKLDILSGSAGSTVSDNLDPRKTPVVVSEVGRADPDVIKSQFHPANRDALLQKGGSSASVQSFTDPKLDGLLEAVASKRLALAYLVDQAYVIPIFEEPQVFAAAPYVKGLRFEAVGRPSFYDTWLDKH